MKWIETSIVTERVVVDEMTALFEQYGKNGFIEEDIDEIYEKLTFFAEVEDEDPLLKEGLWPQKVTDAITMAKLPYLPPIICKVTGEEDWLTGWKEDAQPITILPDLVVAPSWQEKPSVRDGQTVVFYNSELSFGTGAHETTDCCAKLLALHGEKAQKILDIGTGTGILLLVAHHVNPKAELVGIDIDAPSVVQARENCEANGISAQIIEGDLAEKYKDKADLVLANLTVDPLKILLPIISDKLAKDGIVIISGIVDDRYDEIRPYIDSSWRVIEHMHKRNWHTFALKRKDCHEESIS